jgi:hypothetical protein
MSAGTMTKPLDAIKKLRGRSWEEIRTRGGQAFAVYSEQIGLTGKLPSDAEFYSLLDENYFGGQKISADVLLEKFYQNSFVSFFPSFAEKDKTLELFHRHFGEKSARYFIEKAERVVEGKFDLLGYKNLDFGVAVDWHFEPVSGKRSPIKHWKQFDELDAEETGDKKIVWELNRHQHFFTLGVAFWLTGDEKFAATFVRHLESWMEQNPPGTGVNWFSSLEVAFRSISWVWAFNFFKNSNSVTPEFFQKTLKFLFLHARHIEKYLSTYYSPNTHLTGEALGLYYLGTQFPFFKRAEHWREKGEGILFAELDRQILPDGVYFEQATWYQKYTADFYTHFLILKTLADEQTPPQMQDKLYGKLSKMLDFLMYITRPDGTTPLIGDDDGGKILPLGNSRPDDFRAALSTGAVLFERGDYKFAAGELAEETLWLLGLEGVLAFDTLRAKKPEKNSADFTDGGYFVMRDGWTETDNYLLARGGNLGGLSGAHAHADSLSIILAVGGRSVLTDAGTYTYHESEEMRDRFRSSQAHNTLTVDDQSSSIPGGKFSWRSKAETTVKNWISKDRFDFFEASHNGYERLPDNPVTHARSVLFLKNDYWIMRDFVKTSGRHDYRLNFQFDAGCAPFIEKSEDGRTCVSEKSADTGLRMFTFDNGSFEIEDSRVSKIYGEKHEAPRVGFVSNTTTGAQEFFTFLLPTDDYADAPEVFEVAVSGGRAFVIKYLGYMDLFVFADGDRIVRTEYFNTDFRFTWARLGAGDNLPEEFVLIDGTHFSIGSREVLNNPANAKFAIARRYGNKLNVRTDTSVFSVSLPQKNSTTLILKSSEQSGEI